MAIKKIIPHEIQQIFIVGCLIFFVLLFLGGRWMQKRNLVDMKQIKKQRRRVELENRVANKLTKLKKIKEEITVINESSRFLAEIAKMSGQLNMKITSISAAPIEKRNEFIKLGVNLEVDSTYHEIGIFMSRLEAAEIFVTVESLRMTSIFDQDRPESVRVNAKIKLTTFALTDTILEK